MTEGRSGKLRCNMRHTERHAVLVRVRLSDDDLGDIADDELVDRLDDAIRAAVERPPRVGYWDGHEFGCGWAVIFSYGRNAAALATRVTEALLPLERERTVHVIPGEHAPDSLDSVIVFDAKRGATMEH